MSNEFNLNIKDAAKQVVTALPAAGANVTCTALDLEQTVGGDVRNVVLELSVPATPALVEAKVITFTVYHGATTSLAAMTAPAMTATITGGTGGAGTATAVRFALPPSTLRYIGINASIPADGGDNTAVSFTSSLLF